VAHRDVIRMFQELVPADRVELQHQVKVGFRVWTTTTRGTVLRKERRRHSLHYQRNFDDKVFSDVLVLQLDGGEITTVTLDEFSSLRKLESPVAG
jgi:hypothetical protein